jgi:hypothetical protein
LALCACKNVDIPWQRPACAALQLQEDPPEVAVLGDVRAAGDSVLALWRGDAPNDPLLLSTFDGQRWRRPYRLLEHGSALQRTGIAQGGVLLSAIDYESAERQDVDAAVVDEDAGSDTESTPATAHFDLQLTLVNDACNEVPLTRVPAEAMYTVTTLTNRGLAAAAWNDDEGNVQAVVVRAAQEPNRKTVAKVSANVRVTIRSITALSDNSVIATLIERGRTYGDPQRLLTRRFWLQWQEPVQHYATQELDGLEITATTVAAGFASTAALSWVTSTRSKAELHMQRTDDGTSWSDPVVLASEPSITEPQSVLAPDGSRLAVLWRGDDDAWRALIVDGEEPVGDAVDTGCSVRGAPAIAFDPRGQLLIACGNDEGTATLSSFDGATITSTELGKDHGAVTGPKLTARPAGPIMALWEQHDGPAYDMIGDTAILTPAVISSANIIDGEPQDAQPIVP